MAGDDWLGRWERAYVAGDLPWDIGRPQPAFERLAEAGAIAGPTLDSGCGTGEHALLLAAQGIEVVGVDVSATAIRTAQEKARGRGLAATFVVGDVLDLGGLGRTFRSVAQVGPRRVTQAEIRDAFAEGWNVERFVPERFNVRAQFMTHRPHAWLATIVRTPTTT